MYAGLILFAIIVVLKLKHLSELLNNFLDMHRNKASPERTSMLIYEPTKVQRSLDKGDFEQTAAIN